MVANGPSASPVHKAASSESANGTNDSTNGSTSSNGHTAPASKPKLACFEHDREEVTRLLIQSLTDLGYEGAAASLSQESGYDLESPAVAAFRHAILQGQWTEAEELLLGGSTEEGGVSINGNGLALQEDVDQDVMRFWIRQQKFLELLEKQDTGKALMVIRSELTPLNQDTSKLHFLSSLLMCDNNYDLMRRAEWDGANGESRNHLLSELSKRISPSVMLPERRLAILLQQVKRNQISLCLYHNTAASPSLYQDHVCDRNDFPKTSFIELAEHAGEVWLVVFSNNGKRLASCGADGVVMIYEVPSFAVLHTLAEHDSGICALAWSPDDSMIVTCSQDKRARLWTAETGELLHAMSSFQEPVSSCVWAPDGKSFVTGHLDRGVGITQWDTSGKMLSEWGAAHRVQDIALAPDASRLVAADDKTTVFVYNFKTHELEYTIDMPARMGSVSITQNSRYLLVNMLDGEARLLDLDTPDDVLRKFKSYTPDAIQFIIRSTLGGANESFVAIGSESGHIYIWHKEYGQLVEEINGHGGFSCNSISWNPVDPKMFASAGDDSKVKM
ncbi:WD domain-containing protein [Calycina marina]|uniref:WD domain-containing protein n=1 Tax=Calycina marina TaxID=1763456 RepID=A0A9P7Z372_9HELO|nr:WD domain-containing protein [Calycina marina]